MDGSRLSEMVVGSQGAFAVNQWTGRVFNSSGAGSLIGHVIWACSRRNGITIASSRVIVPCPPNRRDLESMSISKHLAWVSDTSIISESGMIDTSCCPMRIVPDGRSTAVTPLAREYDLVNVG